FDELPVALRTREIRALALDRSGAVWIGTPADLVSVDARTHRGLVHYTRTAGVAASPVANGANALEVGPDGTLWIGSDDGVVALDPFTGTFVRHARDLNDPRSLGG